MNRATINCILFVVITYLLTCVVAWIVLPQYLGPLAMFVPGSVAILLTVYNKQKVMDLFKRSSLKNCSLGFIIPAVAAILSACLLWVIITGLDLASLNMEWTLEKAKDWNIVMILFGLLLSFIFGNIGALGEEIGWRAYLLKNLKSQIPNFYIRAIVVGLIWEIWHMQLYRASGQVIWEDGYTFPIACTSVLACCAFSIVLTWLFEKDNSVWPVTIAHATANFFMQDVPMLFTTMSLPVSNYVQIYYWTSLAVAYFIVAIGVIWFDKARGRRLSDS